METKPTPEEISHNHVGISLAQTTGTVLINTIIFLALNCQETMWTDQFYLCNPIKHELEAETKGWLIIRHWNKENSQYI